MKRHLFTSIIVLGLAASLPAHAATMEEITKLTQDGVAQFQAGDSAASAATLRDALDAAEGLWGKDHVYTDNIAYLLASVYVSSGARSSATDLFVRVRDHMEESRPDDPRLARIHYQLGMGWIAAEMEKADREFDKAIKLMEKLSFDTKEHADPDYVRALYGRGYTLMKLYRETRAMRLYSQAVKAGAELFGEDSTVYGEALYAQAQGYVAQGRDKKAAESFEEVLAIYARHMPEDDLNVLAVHTALVPIYERMHEDIKATDHLMIVAEKMPDKEGAARPLYRVQPNYPSRKAMSGEDGEVLLRFRITTSGHVDDITVKEGNPDSAFTKAAVEAVEQWRYKPRFENGKPVSSFGEFRMRFEGLDYTPTGSHITR